MFHPAAKHGIRERETGQGATPINPDRFERRRIYLQQQAALAGEMSYDTGTGQGATPIKPRAQAPTAEDMIHPAVARGDNLPPGGAAKTGAAPAEQPYDHGTGEGATPINPNRFARRGLDKLGGYFDGRPGEQFWEAPLGGHVRNYLADQKVFGHTITEGQARMAEQGLAGLTAVGVGVPAFLAAVNQLSTPQTPDTIPL